jgi:tripeptidyl-peptidase-1
MKAGARGITVFVASGDHGAAGIGSCSGGKFDPEFPASCPFVTAVGSTGFDSNGDEEASHFSGGGFSNVFPMPSYQSSKVNSYIKEKLSNCSYASMYNTQGRAYPDVALLGENYKIIVNGNSSITGGTSASSPAFAALISKANDH